MLTEANPRVYGKLVRARILALLQPGDYAGDLLTVVARCTPPEPAAPHPFEKAV